MKRGLESRKDNHKPPWASSRGCEGQQEEKEENIQSEIFKGNNER